MCSCGGCTGKLEVLSYLLKLLDIANSSIHETDFVTSARFKQIKTKTEELQIKTMREILYREDTVMEQLRLVVRHIDGMRTGSQDAMFSARFVQNLDQIDASIDKAIAAASETDGLYKRAKRSKEFDKKEGPWGPHLGLVWDMGPLHDMKTIYVSATDDRIHSIRFEYKLDNIEYKTPTIGGEGGTLHQIELVADEVIKFVRGAYDTAGLTRLEIITSIKTHSFGKGNGESSVFPPTSKLDCNYKVVGFFGRASSCVTAIGLYMEKCPDCPPDKSSP